MEKYLQLLAELDRITDLALAAGRPFTAEEDKKIDELNKEIASLKKVVDMAKAREARGTQIAAPTVPATPTPDGAPVQQAAGGQTIGTNLQVTKAQEDKKQFESPAHHLLAMRRASQPNNPVVDPRLEVVNKRAAASGVSTREPDTGGYLLEEDSSQQLEKMTWEADEFLKRVSVSGTSKQKVNVPIFNNWDRSISGGISGGVKVYNTREAEQYTKSAPTVGKMAFEVHKYTALFVETDEMSDDIPSMQSLFLEQLPIAFADKYVFDCFNGGGVDEFKGILDTASPSTYQVAKKVGQANGTVVVENITSMYARLPAALRSQAIWLMDQELESQLPLLTIGDQPVFIQPGTGLSEAPYGKLRGIPAIPFAHAKAFGQRGDLMLVVPKLYRIITRKNMTVQTSIHVRFEYGEVMWRAEQRAAGGPGIPSTIKNPSAFEMAAFLVLEKRAA